MASSRVRTLDGCLTSLSSTPILSTCHRAAIATSHQVILPTVRSWSIESSRPSYRGPAGTRLYCSSCTTSMAGSMTMCLRLRRRVYRMIFRSTRLVFACRHSSCRRGSQRGAYWVRCRLTPIRPHIDTEDHCSALSSHPTLSGRALCSRKRSIVSSDFATAGAAILALHSLPRSAFIISGDAGCRVGGSGPGCCLAARGGAWFSHAGLLL